MTAQEAYQHLDPQQWANTSIHERLYLLEKVRSNLGKYAEELAAADTKMKNDIMGEEIFRNPESMVGTAVPIANTLSACIHLYESLAKGKMPEAEKVTQVKEGLYDVEVKPLDAKDRLIAGNQRFHLRTKGVPKQINPMEKPAGIIAVSGAGNYSSSLEMVKAMFLENCTVIHKPHQLNEATDRIWEKVFQPLVEAKAIAFCDADQGRKMTTLEGLSKIYFTGGTSTAKAIMQATNTPLVSECGGNNPLIVVPGDRAWTAKEMEHQANQIITAAKLNGGAVCGRPQTIITSRGWAQREAFLEALKKAIVEGTPAAGTYYPGSDKVKQDFLDQYPKAQVLSPEHGRFKHGDFIFIEDVAADSYAVQHEAFCQIMNEIPLDVAANAAAFLPAATEFCNHQLLGTLGCMIILDEDTQKAHSAVLDETVTALNYGGIAVNTIPPLIFFNPLLTWGGNEEGKTFVSGIGNFGNVYCFENIEKSILYDDFMSPGHLMRTNQKAFDHLSIHMTDFALQPSWINLTRLVGGAVVDSFRKKDF
ncbi:MAG: aldehyde dehydrogenase family protein [Bacteroidota bacterium]